jgi:hypothetical protein
MTPNTVNPTWNVRDPDATIRPGQPDWSAVHTEVQAALAELDGPLTERFPGLEIRPWFSSLPAFPFQSYRTYRWPNRPELESVVVEVSYGRINGRMALAADVVGEESGRGFLEVCDRPVEPNDLPALPTWIRDAARELGRHPEAVVAGLTAILAGETATL